jgi:hypothetical protein
MNVPYPSPDSETTLAVLVREDRPDYLIVRAGLRVAPGHRVAIQGFSDLQFREFRFNLMRDLLSAHLAQYRLEIPEQGKDLESVLLSRRLWPEAITVQGLSDAMQAVYDCMLLASIRIRFAVGDTP